MPSLHFKDNGQDVVFPIAEGETPQKALVRYKAYKMYGVQPDVDIKAAGEAAAATAGQQYADSRPVVGRAAAVGAGMADIGRNLGNMVGAVSDEDVNAATERDKPLEKTYPGMHTVGQVAPTVLGGAGLGMLPKVGAMIAAHPYMAAAVQGGVYGAAAANPNERKLSAALGAVTAPVVGAVLNKTVQAAGRGLAPMSQRAKDYIATLKKMDPSADTYLPVSMAASRQGQGSAFQRGYENILPMHGPSDRMLQQQVRGAENAGYKAALNLGYGQKNAAAMMDVAAPGGANVARLDKALALNPLPTGLPSSGSPTRGVLQAATQAPGRLGTPSFSQIGDQALKENLSRAVPAKTLESLKDLTYGISELTKGSKPGSSVTDRALAYGLFHKVTAAASIAGWGTIGAVARGLSSKPFQNFVLGNTAVQKQIATTLAKQGPEAAVTLLTQLAQNYTAVNAGSAPEAVVQGLGDAAMGAASIPAAAAQYSVPGVAASQGANLLREYK